MMLEEYSEEQCECSDCQKPRALCKCDHCEQPVCGDCEMAHNVLQSEMNTLLQSIQENALETAEKEEKMETAGRILEKNRQMETEIINAFDKAAKLAEDRLATRKQELLDQVRMFAKFQDAIVEGKQESVIQETHEEISSCHRTDGLRQMKRTLTLVEAGGGRSENQENPAFSYDLSGLLETCENIGAIAFNGVCSVNDRPKPAVMVQGMKPMTVSELAAAVFQERKQMLTDKDPNCCSKSTKDVEMGDAYHPRWPPHQPPWQMPAQMNRTVQLGAFGGLMGAPRGYVTQILHSGQVPPQRPPFKYASSVRNPQHPGLVPVQPPPPQQAVMVQGQKPLTASELAAAQPKEQKQMLGERLFPLIKAMFPDLAGKITGMLLECNNSELLHMLEYNELLHSKVEEAVQVLKAHQAKKSETSK